MPGFRTATALSVCRIHPSVAFVHPHQAPSDARPLDLRCSGSWSLPRGWLSRRRPSPMIASGPPSSVCIRTRPSSGRSIRGKEPGVGASGVETTQLLVAPQVRWHGVACPTAFCPLNHLRHHYHHRERLVLPSRNGSGIARKTHGAGLIQAHRPTLSDPEALTSVIALGVTRPVPQTRPGCHWRDARAAMRLQACHGPPAQIPHRKLPTLVPCSG
ncbi:hypothetical protein M432DRAFT_362128 [Thermoascus aurantiacus ATCC 26904]